jgi:nucleoside-diphosphate-sugar epimerase
VKVLLTGASGTIGRPLTAALAAAGQDVRAAVRDRRARQFPSGVETVRLPDLAGPVDWPPLLDGMDAVVHLAGVAHTGLAEGAYDQINHVATATLARAAAAAGLRRFVFVSSIRAQTGAHAARPLRESDPARPTDAYGRSKLAAEQAVRAAGVPFTVLRPVLVYAPGAKGNLANLIRLAGSPLPLPFGRLVNRRSLLSVDNLTAAIRFALEDPRSENETFIVSDPEAVSVAEIVTICRGAMRRGPGLLPVPPKLFASLLGLVGQGEQWDRLAGSLETPPAKLLAAGWRPVTDTEAGLAAMMRRR